MFSSITISVAECHTLSLAVWLGIHWAHFSWAGWGHDPWGGRSALWFGSRMQRSWRVTSHITHCLEAGSQPCLCWIIQRTSLTRLTARGHSASRRSFHTGVNLFSVPFYHLNSDCDNKNGSQTFWGTDEHLFKHYQKRNSHGHLAINTKPNCTTGDNALYLFAMGSSGKDIVEWETRD